MATLAEVLGTYVQRLGDTAAGERPLDGTDAAVRRKRGVRRGVTTGASVVGIGILFTGGTVGLGYYESIQPPWYYLPEGGGTVVIAVDGPDPTIPDIGIECGDPAPVAVPAADGFTVEALAPGDGGFHQESDYVSSVIRVINDNVEQFPAFVMSPTVVVVQDGVVVSVHNDAAFTERLSFTPGRKAIPQHFQVSSWDACDESLDHVLPPGEYEYYVITTVANSPEIAALSRATDVYGQGPWFRGDRWLEPTDWECSVHDGNGPFSGWSANAPACLPRVRPEFACDAQARTVTMPYSDGRVTRVFSAQLVSGPFPYTSTGNAWAEEIPLAEVSYAPDDPTAQCGEEIQGDERGAPAHFISTTLNGTSVEETGRTEAEVWVDFGPEAFESRTATLDMPGSSPALLTANDEVTRGGYNLSVEVVVGKARVTVNDGRDITISRATGPANVRLEYDGIEWCDGVVPTGGIGVYVGAPLPVSADDGTRDSQWFHVYSYYGY